MRFPLAFPESLTIWRWRAELRQDITHQDTILRRWQTRRGGWRHWLLVRIIWHSSAIWRSLLASRCLLLRDSLLVRCSGGILWSHLEGRQHVATPSRRLCLVHVCRMPLSGGLVGFRTALVLPLCVNDLCWRSYLM